MIFFLSWHPPFSKQILWHFLSNEEIVPKTTHLIHRSSECSLLEWVGSGRLAGNALEDEHPACAARNLHRFAQLENDHVMFFLDDFDEWWPTKHHVSSKCRSTLALAWAIPWVPSNAICRILSSLPDFGLGGRDSDKSQHLLYILNYLWIPEGHGNLVHFLHNESGRKYKTFIHCTESVFCNTVRFHMHAQKLQGHARRCLITYMFLFRI